MEGVDSEDLAAGAALAAAAAWDLVA